MDDLEVQAREAIREGAEYIAEHGHYKSGFFPADGRPYEDKIDDGLPACALGGILSSTRKMNATFFNAAELLRTRLEVDSIGQWNDQEDISAEEIILQMKRVAHDDG
jgi:hypothetical protein